MPRFHFHIMHGAKRIPDEEGSELPDLEAAYLWAFASAQELWTVLLQRREDPTAYTFEIADASGQLLCVLPLNEVLETARGRPLPRNEAVMKTSSLLQRTQALRDALTNQITATQTSLGETRALIQNLRPRSEAD